MTEAEILERARERLDETLGADSQRYTTADLTQYALDCARWFIARTGCQYASEAYTQTAYQLLEYLPCDCIQVERVTWESDADKYPLDPTHTRELDATNLLWQRQTDSRSRAYFILGLDRIGFWPESADGGEEYTVHYQQDVYDSVAAVPVEYHEHLVSGVVARCLLAEHKAAKGMKEYAAFRQGVASYSKARSSPDRVWSMGR